MVLWCVLVGSPLSWLDFAHAAFFGLARALLMLFALLRGGLLSLVVALFVMFSLLEVPLTLDFTAWFAMRALPVLLVVLGLSLYGFKTALAGKPLFGRELLDD
jgi:hypothetical protein